VQNVKEGSLSKQQAVKLLKKEPSGREWYWDSFWLCNRNSVFSIPVQVLLAWNPRTGHKCHMESTINQVERVHLPGE
jgi:hypothetical protein